MARKLKLKIISKEQEKIFFSQNHVQGYKPSKICYGLVDEDNSVAACMSFGFSRFNKNYDYELLRYANKLNCTVIGGAEKLFKNFVNDNPGKSIISYCDRSLFTGSVYSKIGFKYSHNSTPSYFYTRNYKDVFNRLQFQKHKLSKKLKNFDRSLSEWENMKMNGWDRYWDCGNSVWIFDK
jgi:hypothetical protein